MLPHRSIRRMNPETPARDPDTDFRYLFSVLHRPAGESCSDHL